MKFEVINGSFGYGSAAILHDVSFSLEGNQVLAVLGPNGVGKTTLLKCMMGLLKWNRGETRIDGLAMDTMSHSRIWKRIAYVPQSKGISLSYTALEMVLMGRSARLGLFAQPSREDMAIAEKAMEEVGITFLKDKQCSRMSGGELQMVLIARALCTQPEMLILDEPESNLDFKNQLVILDIVKQRTRDRGHYQHPLPGSRLKDCGPGADSKPGWLQLLWRGRRDHYRGEHEKGFFRGGENSGLLLRKYSLPQCNSHPRLLKHGQKTRE